jgi:hypothetical protein
MKHDSSSEDGTKGARQRFFELGSKLMAVPKADVDERDKRWHAAKAKRSRTKRSK